MTSMPPVLILGSSSPYRRELLERLRIPFLISSPEVDETPRTGETPSQLACRLAVQKAHVVAQRHPGAVVIGADQAASLHGIPLGKPGTRTAAREQLQHMSGQTVIFHSALVVMQNDNIQSADITTTCVFRSLSETAIERYLDIDQPFDTAGSAKAECLGIALMQSMDSSDPTAIIGLPLIALTRMLTRVGLDPLLQGRLPHAV